MMKRTAFAVTAFVGSFVVSANVKPPPCQDCAVAPVPVIVVTPAASAIVPQDGGSLRVKLTNSN